MRKKNLKKLLIVANWKMSPETLSDARRSFDDLKRRKFDNKKITAVICPPFLFLGDLANNYRGKNFLFGAQDVHFKKDQQSTGEISTTMLKELGAKYVIIGHNERRAIGESNEIVALKTKRVIEDGLIPIVCIGEKERDETGEYLKLIKEQLKESLKKVIKKNGGKLVIAYEPVWAVGRGHKAMTGEELHQTSLYIRKVLSQIFGRKTGMDIPVLYGGSVDSDNCQDILGNSDVDGLLVGRASTNPHVFGDILKEAGGKD